MRIVLWHQSPVPNATGYCKIYCTFRTKRKSVYNFVFSLRHARPDRAEFSVLLNFCLHFQQIFPFLFISDPLTKDEFNQGKKGLQDGISNLNDSIGSFDTEDPNFLIVISKISIVEFWAIANLLCVKQLIFNKKIQSEVADYAQQIKWG